MIVESVTRRVMTVLCCVLWLGTTAPVQAQESFVPQVGQAGKDVVWVPTPPALVERMLDLAKVTREDFVVDLGSGDGRMVIAAARRGARSLGIEFNPKMVEMSKQSAAAAGVGEQARFIEGDMFRADFSTANVLALFLLPSNMNRLREKFFNLEPGTRIVSNTFGIVEWMPDETSTLDGCTAWCTALLWIVPAKAGGTWKMDKEEIVLTQNFQMVTGTVGGVPIENGRIRGRELRFTVNQMEFVARLTGSTMEGDVRSPGTGVPVRSWRATRSGG